MAKRVRCIKRSHYQDITVGKEYEVISESEVSYTVKKDTSGTFPYLKSFFAVVHNYPNPPHKHAELIKTWAEGAEIQFKKSGETRWLDYAVGLNPQWHLDVAYRIKPSVDEEKLHGLNVKLDKLKNSMEELEENMRQVKAKIGEVQNA